MRRFLIGFVCVVMAVAIAGCGAPKSASSQEAIKKAETLQTVEEKAQFLVGQAKAFYASKQFQETIDTAQHVLVYLDKDSQAARGLIEKAKNDLMAAGKKKLDDAKKQFGL